MKPVFKAGSMKPVFKGGSMKPVFKGGSMKPVLRASILLAGFLRIACPYQTTGIHIRKLTSSKMMINDDYEETGNFSLIIHLFALNHSSEYLVKHQSNFQFKMFSSEKELPKDNSEQSVWQKIGISVDIKVMAYQLGHPNFDVTAPIVLNGIDSGLSGRGFNIVVLSQKDGRILKKRVFDTYSYYSASDGMIRFIDSSDDGSIFVIAVRDDGSEQLTQAAKGCIKRLGSRYVDGLDFRDTLALVASKGGPKPPWFQEDYKKAGNGPSSLNVRIWL